MTRMVSAVALLAVSAALSTSLLRLGHTRWPFFWRRTAPPAQTTIGEPPPPHQPGGLYSEDERGAPHYRMGRPLVASWLAVAVLVLLGVVIVLAIVL